MPLRNEQKARLICSKKRRIPMNDVTSCQNQLFDELDELFVALSEKLISDGELELSHGNVLLKVVFERDYDDSRFIFIDTSVNGELFLLSKYDNNNDDTAHTFKNPFNKAELHKVEKVIDAVSVIREEL